MSDPLIHALAYAKLGWRIVPLHNINGQGKCTCLRGICDGPGKHPRLNDWPKQATTDEKAIRGMWARWPEANIGMAMGGGFVDIETEAECAENLSRLEENLGPLPDTVSWSSGGGGMHRLFRTSLPIGNLASIGQEILGIPKTGVDVRGEGGQAVMPPSSHISGGTYRWTNLTPDAIELAELPEAWAMFLSATRRVTVVASDAGNSIPSGQRNVALSRLAGAMRRVGMTEAELLAAIERVNADRCQPPLPTSEIRCIASSVARYPPDQVSVALVEDHFGQDFSRSPAASYLAVAQLLKEYTSMCKPIIHGLLREGEIMNVIAAPKTGKSWIVLDLALSIVTGRPWLEFPTTKGRVLLLDNELHPQTLANRIPRVADALQLPPGDWGQDFCVKTLRGQLQDLFKMEEYFKALPAGHFKLIILDAFYRFMPRDMDENDNGTMANLYNLLDRWAARLEAAFVLIHHTTKGLQSDKGVTDVGAGAGSQSRAADCHLILRPHEQDGCLSVDAVARSWPSPPSFVVRQQFPLWVPDHTLDPSNLKKPNKRQKPATEGPPDEAAPADWTAETFAGAFVDAEPKSKAAILLAANEHDLSDYRAGKFLERAEALGFVHRWTLDHNRVGYATTAQPSLNLDGDAEDVPSKRNKVMAALRQNPNQSSREVAEQCEVSKRYVNKVRQSMQESGN